MTLLIDVTVTRRYMMDAALKKELIEAVAKSKNAGIEIPNNIGKLYYVSGWMSNSNQEVSDVLCLVARLLDGQDVSND